VKVRGNKGILGEKNGSVKNKNGSIKNMGPVGVSY